MTSARWSFEASREAPAQGRQAIREFLTSAKPTPWALDAIALCVTEAMTNVVMHAYRQHEQAGRIEIAATLDGDSLSVRVRDHGHGLAPRVDSPGLGLGLPLIARMSTCVEIVSPKRGGGTEIVMQFCVNEENRVDRR